MSIYLFDKLEKLVDIVESDLLIEWTHTVQVNAYERASFELPVDYNLNGVDYFGFFHTDETFRIFRVTEEKLSDVYYVEGIDKAESDLRTVAIIKDRRPQNATADQALVVALEGTGYELGTVSGLHEVRSLSFYYISPAEALTKIIETYGCEFRVRYTFIENRITSRYIDLAKRFGKVSGKQFLYGDNALSIEHEETADDVVTALIGRGKGEETDAGGYGRRIEFTDVVWSKKNGNPVDKPAGQNYVVSETARQAYGLSQDGQLKHRWGVFVDEKIEDKEVLLQRTYEELQKLSVPITTFKASILAMNGEADYGDSVAIIRDEIGIAFEARLHKVVYDKLDSDRTTVELGDYATLQARQSRAQANKITEAIDGAMASVSAEMEAFNRMVEEKIATKNAEIDDAIRVAQLNMDNALELAKVNAENYANNVKSQIDAEFDAFEESYQSQKANQDREIAGILEKANASKNLADEAKRIGEQAKTDAASAIARANQVKTEAIADARAQVATVNQALNTAKTDLQSAIDSVDQKARDSQASASAIRNDLNLQSAKILEQARAQTDLTNRLTTVETTANSTKTTVTELSKTVDKATGDITSVSNRTKVVEDGLAGVKTNYTQLNQTVNTQTGQISSINQKTAQLESGLEGVTNRFENIWVSEKNLLSQTETLAGASPLAYPTNNYLGRAIKRITKLANTSAYAEGLVIQTNETLVNPKEMILSFYVKANQNAKIQCFMYNPNASKDVLTSDGYSAKSAVDGKAELNVTISWQRVWVKWSYTVNYTAKPWIVIGRISDSYTTDVVVDISAPALYHGHHNKEWNPAGLDFKNELATYVQDAQESSADLSRRIETADGKAVDAKAYAQQTANGFNTRIESLESYKNAEGTRAEQYLSASRTETAKQLSAERTAIASNYVAKSTYTEDVRGTNQQLTEIKSTADTTKQNLANYQTTVDRKLTELTSSTQMLDGKINTANTKVDTVAGQIRTEISEVKGKIPTSVGGRNYIRDYSLQSIKLSGVNSEWRLEFFKHSISKSGVIAKATCTQRGSGTAGFYFKPIDLTLEHLQNRTMTWSLDIWVNRTPIRLESVGFETSGLLSNVTLNTSRLIKTFVVQRAEFNNFVVYSSDFRVGDVVYMMDLQLEDGTLATTPTPSPESTVEAIETVKTTITNTANGVEQLSNKVTESFGKITQAETKINQLIGDVSSKVSQQDYDTLTGRVSSAETLITQNTNEISKRLTSTQVETAINAKGYQTKSDVDSNITGRGYITGAALQPYATTTVLENKVRETADSFIRTIIETKALIPNNASVRNVVRETSTFWSPYVPVNINNNFRHKLGTVVYGDATNVKAGSKVNLFVYISVDNVVLSSSATNPTVRLQVFNSTATQETVWSVAPFNGKWSKPLSNGNNYHVIKLTDTITSAHVGSNQSFTVELRIDGASSAQVHHRAMLVTTGDIFPENWSPAPEDFATVTAFNRVEDTVSSHTRTIADQGNSISQVIQTSNGILSRVGALENNSATKSALTATQTEVSQLAGSYAIRNLTSAGALISGINLGADGVNRFDGRLTHITGQTLIDNAVIKSAMVDKLKTANFEAGSVTANIIASEAVTASHLKADNAFFDKLVANDALLGRLVTRQLFATSVQSVDLSAERVTSGVLRARNQSMYINLDRSEVDFYNNAGIQFHSFKNSIFRENNGITGFLNFQDIPYGTTAALGVTSHHVGVVNIGNENFGKFAGFMARRNSDVDDYAQIYGDEIQLRHGSDGHQYYFKTSKLSHSINMNQIVNAVKALATIFSHLTANGYETTHANMKPIIQRETELYLSSISPFDKIEI